MHFLIFSVNISRKQTYKTYFQNLNSNPDSLQSSPLPSNPKPILSTPHNCTHRPTLLHRLNPSTHISLSLYLDFPSCTIHHPHQCTLSPSMALNPTRPSSSLSPPKKAQWKASTSPSLSTTPYHLLKRDFIEIKIKGARWFTYTVVKWMDFERFIACPDQLVYLSRLVMKDSTRDGVKTWS